MQYAATRPLSSGRWRLWSLAVLAAAAALVLTVSTFLPTRETIPPTSATSTARLPELGIEFEYPSNWHLQRFGERIGIASHTGAVVANVDHTFEHPDLGPDEGTSAWDMRGLPEGLIVLSFEQLDRHNPEARTTKGFPVRLADAVTSRDAEEGIDVYGAPQPRYFIPFGVAGHLHSSVHVFFGDVDGDERAVIDRILASVRPFTKLPVVRLQGAPKKATGWPRSASPNTGALMVVDGLGVRGRTEHRFRL